MPICDTIDKSIESVFADAVATNQLPFVAADVGVLGARGSVIGAVPIPALAYRLSA